jgi:hypothetical protein
VGKILLSLILLSATASQYSPGVMDGVIATRQAGLTSMDLPQSLPEASGFIAVLDCGEIGNLIWVRRVGGPWERFLVTDCSGHKETTSWMTRNGIYGEVDYGTAVRWGVVGRGVKVEVLLGQRVGYAYD